jgi:hypothetical protein
MRGRELVNRCDLTYLNFRFGEVKDGPENFLEDRIGSV